MDRNKLESLIHRELQIEACRLHISAERTAAQLRDRIIDHYAKHGPRGDFVNEEREATGVRETANDREPSGRDDAAFPTAAVNQIVTSISMVMMKQQQELKKQQQQFLERMMQLMPIDRGPSPEPSTSRNPSERVQEAGPSRESSAAVSISSSRNTEMRSDGAAEGVPGNQVAWLASQIPEFEGSADDNVQNWIERVDSVAQVHRASQGVTLLAASSMLKKDAKGWYNYQRAPIISSWSALKNEMTRVFNRELPYDRVLEKVHARKWNPAKESFDRYALSKMALIDRLNVPQKDAIHMLVKGITNFTLKTVTLSMPKTTVNDFLDRMREITEGTADTVSKTAATTSTKTKDRPCGNCGKRGHTHTEFKTGLICYNCKAKGHRASDCPTQTARKPTGSGRISASDGRCGGGTGPGNGDDGDSGTGRSGGDVSGDSG